MRRLRMLMLIARVVVSWVCSLSLHRGFGSRDGGLRSEFEALRRTSYTTAPSWLRNSIFDCRQLQRHGDGRCRFFHVSVLTM